LTLKNEKDEDVDVSTLAEENGVVFFLVPKADTREPNTILSIYSKRLIPGDHLCSRVYHTSVWIQGYLPRLHICEL
jgi:hypothetical protein